MIEVIILAFVLILLAVAGLGIKLLFDRNAEFRGGSCQATANSAELQKQGVSCGCAGDCENGS